MSSDGVKLHLPKESITRSFSRSLLLLAIEVFDDRIVGYTDYSLTIGKRLDDLFKEIRDA
jgi:hypothetical protein